MKLVNRILVSILGLAIMSSSSFAAAPVGMTMEPYAGYTLGGSLNSNLENAQLNAIPVPAPSYDYTGFTLGARALVTFQDIFFAGPDFSWTPSENASSNGVSSTLSYNNVRLGFIAGAQLPSSFRVWAGINLLDYHNFSQNTISGTFRGVSFKIGAGYSLLPNLSLNAEYIASRVDDMKVTMGSASGTFTSNIGSGKAFLLSVSAPITLPFQF